MKIRFANNPWKVSMMTLVLGLSAFFIGCEEEAVDDSTLTLESAPSSLKVGDTSALLSCTKEARNLQGRMETTKGYTGFYLAVGDTTKAKVYGERRLIALQAGTVKFIARDKSGSLASDSMALTVVP